MTSELSYANIYTDFQGLAKLRVQAQQESDTAIRTTAKQFESLFIQLMLKEMRETVQKSDLFDQQSMEFYEDMYDQQLSLHLAQGEGLGLTDIIERQLSGEAAVGIRNRDIQQYKAGLDLTSSHNASIEDLQSVSSKGSPLQSQLPEIETDIDVSSPQAFVQTMLPLAQQAAAKLGVQPQVLIAQAALETGWGQSIIHGADGRSSNNLFNIKSHASWAGQQVNMPTLEFEQGVAVRRQASFRAYESVSDSFNDYVKFLQSEPRYQQALSVAADPRA